MDLLSDITNKLQLIEDQFSIISEKSSVFAELGQLHRDCEEIEAQRKMIHRIVEQDNAELRAEHAELRENVSRTTSMMLFALQELEKRSAPIVNEKNMFLNVHAAKSPANPQTPLTTPRIALSMYSKSPLIKKRTKSLMFADFEADIRQEDFEQIPSYMRGRTSLGELQDFLDKVLIKCFNKKYEIYHKTRACLSTKDFQLQQLFISQASYFEGEHFITLNDLNRVQNKPVDKREERHLQCLRFLKIIKEIRKNSMTCYVWMNKL